MPALCRGDLHPRKCIIQKGFLPGKWQATIHPLTYTKIRLQQWLSTSVISSPTNLAPVSSHLRVITLSSPSCLLYVNQNCRDCSKCSFILCKNDFHQRNKLYFIPYTMQSQTKDLVCFLNAAKHPAFYLCVLPRACQNVLCACHLLMIQESSLKHA